MSNTQQPATAAQTESRNGGSLQRCVRRMNRKTRNMKTKIEPITWPQLDALRAALESPDDAGCRADALEVCDELESKMTKPKRCQQCGSRYLMQPPDFKCGHCGALNPPNDES